MALRKLGFKRLPVCSVRPGAPCGHARHILALDLRLARARESGKHFEGIVGKVPLPEENGNGTTMVAFVPCGAERPIRNVRVSARSEGASLFSRVLRILRGLCSH